MLIKNIKELKINELDKSTMDQYQYKVFKYGNKNDNCESKNELKINDLYNSIHEFNKSISNPRFSKNVIFLVLFLKKVG